jgi:hypothetical protein
VEKVSRRFVDLELKLKKEDASSPRFKVSTEYTLLGIHLPWPIRLKDIFRKRLGGATPIIFFLQIWYVV